MVATSKSSSVSDAPVPTFHSELRQGWRPGLGATVGMATGLGLFLLTNGFFLKPLAAEYHWTRGQIGLGSFTSLIGAIAMPVAGWLSDRYGPRVIGAAGLAAIATGFLGLASMQGSIITYYLWLVQIGILGAAASAIVLSRPIAEAFNRFRGAALGIGLGLSAFMVVLILPTVQAVIARYGWRAGYLCLAGLSGILGVGAVTLLVRTGARVERGTRGALQRGPLAAALHDRRFWLMFIAMLSANMCFGGLLGQLPAMLGDRGISPMQVGFVMSLLAMAAVCGRLLEGVAMDRLWAPAVAFTTLLIPIAGLMLLLEPKASLRQAVSAVFLIGLAQGGEATTLSFFIARYFGFGAYSAIYGALAIAIGISLAIGGTMFGFVYDWTKSYNAAIVVAACGLVVAATCLLCTGFTPATAKSATSDVGATGSRSSSAP
jgi:MFS family permease